MNSGKKSAVLFVYCLSFVGGLVTQQEALSASPSPMIRKPAPLALPTQTPLWGYALDSDGVIQYYLGNTKEKVYNVYEVAMEVMDASPSFFKNAESLVGMHKNLVPKLPDIPPSQGLNKYQIAALNWLDENKKAIGNDAYIWNYRFDDSYNDIRIMAPWPSAFGQAYVIKAFMFAYSKTGDEKYKHLAMAAARAYAVPISENGFRASLSDGSVFFEEIPTTYPSHILNAHLVSTAILLQIGKDYGDASFVALGEQGIDTLKKHLTDYDLGYWSRYDLNPKKGEILFRLAPQGCASNGAIAVDKVALLDSDTGKATSLDIGEGDDATGAWRISGTDWSQPEVINGNSVRRILYGPGIRTAPVSGGSIQNSYVIMQLPEIEFKHLDAMPTFYLRIDYLDEAAGVIDVQIQDIDHGNFLNFKTLANGSLNMSGDHKWKRAYVPVEPKDLAWYMGPDYQAFHVQVLESLYALTNDDFFESYAERWKAYLEMHQEQNPELSLGEAVHLCKGYAGTAQK